MIDISSIAGYGPMSVEDIISTAGISRRTFYDYFPNKETVFLECFDRVTAELRETVQVAYDSTTDPTERAVACATALVEFVAEDPARAEMGLVEVLAAGPEAIARRNQTMAFLADLLRQGIEELPGVTNIAPLTAETIIGGLYEILYTRVVRGETATLVALVPDLVHALALPYIGYDTASQMRDQIQQRKSVPEPVDDPVEVDTTHRA